ncbi:hypothetical protein HDU91_001880 [Kappamyces sp. JEL0680]|nr:hypothetical protein HDU91_001880 [Kappamyces sp. JEL0680]
MAAIAQTVTWVLFDHWSQSSDWLGLFIFATNDWSIENPIVRALVMMPFLRFLGDLVWRTIYYIMPASIVLNSSLPGPLWFSGELFGDTYLPFKALAFCRDFPQRRKAVYAGYSLIFLVKGGNCVFRLVFCVLQLETAVFFNILSYFDMASCVVSSISDCICCYIIYKSADQITSKKVNWITSLLKTLVLNRFVFMLVIRLITGLLLTLYPCDSAAVACTLGPLRDVFIKIEYQVCYLDYLLMIGMKKCKGDLVQGHPAHQAKRVTGKEENIARDIVEDQQRTVLLQAPPVRLVSATSVS